MKLGAICVFSKPVDPAQIKKRLEDIGRKFPESA